MESISFTKAEALSNDFIIIDDRATGRIAFGRDEIVRLCERRLGIGADGILLLQPSKDADFKMRTLNADGSEAEMCGNGIRCAVKFVHDSLEGSKSAYAVETPAGTRYVTITTETNSRAEAIRVDLGKPVFEEKSTWIDILGKKIEITSISMGNPHAIVFVDDVAQTPVEHIGPAIEGHEFFPDKTNVEFIKVIGSDHIEMRVWERGAGETAACGTGAAAALVGAHIRGLIGRKATVHLIGGDLQVEWPEDGRIYITGGANIVYSGTIGDS